MPEDLPFKTSYSVAIGCAIWRGFDLLRRTIQHCSHFLGEPSPLKRWTSRSLMLSHECRLSETHTRSSAMLGCGETGGKQLINLDTPLYHHLLQLKCVSVRLKYYSNVVLDRWKEEHQAAKTGTLLCSMLRCFFLLEAWGAANRGSQHYMDGQIIFMDFRGEKKWGTETIGNKYNGKSYVTQESKLAKTWNKGTAVFGQSMKKTQQVRKKSTTKKVAANTLEWKSESKIPRKKSWSKADVWNNSLHQTHNDQATESTYKKPKLRLVNQL